MAQAATFPVEVDDARPARGYVEWSAVFAGALVAAAISFVLLTFGAAIGLSLTSPWPSSGLSGRAVVYVAVAFAVIQQIGSFMAGGYIAGRLRRRWHEGDADESDFRDGVHGALVWAVAVVIGAILVFSTAGALAKTGVAAAGTAAQNADTVIDNMMLPLAVAQASPPPTATPPANAEQNPAAMQPLPAETRAELARIVGAAIASDGLTAQSKAYLVQFVVRRTGVSAQEAERRVDAAMTTAREAADKTRRATMLAALVTGVSLIVSFATAWWAAIKGGNHRDTGVAARFSFAPQRRRVIKPGA